MSIDIDERSGRRYNDDMWPDGYDAVALAIPGDWKNAEVTFTAPESVISYEDRQPINGRTVIASKSLTGVVYVLTPPSVSIHSSWRKNSNETTHTFEIPEAPVDEFIDFRDGRKLVLNVEKENPEYGDQITVTEIFSTYRSHSAYIRAIDMIQADDVILDLGAHIGTFTRDAIAKKPRKVIAIEANQRNYSLLRRNVELADTSQTETEVIFAAATKDQSVPKVRLWVYPQRARIDKPSKMRFVVSSTTHSRFKVPVAAPAKGWREMLDEYKPTIVKIDTEGEECSWDFTNLPSQLRAVVIEAEVMTQLKRSDGSKYLWYDEDFVPQMTQSGFARVEPKKLWGHTRDELWVRNEVAATWE